MKFTTTQMESTDGVWSYRLSLKRSTDLWSVLRWPVGRSQIPPCTDILTVDHEWMPVLKQTSMREVLYIKPEQLDQAVPA